MLEAFVLRAFALRLLAVLGLAVELGLQVELQEFLL